MSWLKKRDDSTTPGNSVHVRTVLSTKPGHKVLRRERCECDHGQARGGCMSYENPES